VVPSGLGVGKTGNYSWGFGSKIVAMEGRGVEGGESQVPGRKR